MFIATSFILWVKGLLNILQLFLCLQFNFHETAEADVDSNNVSEGVLIPYKFWWGKPRHLNRFGIVLLLKKQAYIP